MLLTIAMFTGTSELHNRYLLALFFLLQLYLSYKTNFKASPLWCISHSSIIIPEIELIPFCFILPQYPINSNLFFSTLHHQRRSTFYSCVSSPVQFSSGQSLSHVRIFATPWTATGQASLSIINSRNLPKLMQRVDSLEKTLMLGGIEGRRRRGRQRVRWLDLLAVQGTLCLLTFPHL